MTVFEAVKQISCNDAAERLGLKGKRTSAGKGMWCCPFHDDHSPSMACFDRDNRFYCFSCHASGDAANLFARVRGLSPVQGARAALEAFGLLDEDGRRAAGCDRPQARTAIIRPGVVSKAARMIREEFRKGVEAFLSGQAQGMTGVMEKFPDQDGWLWNHALQRACRVQEEATRWRDMSDEDVQSEIREALLADCTPHWGEALPTPGRTLFREIMDELEGLNSSFPKLNLPEVEAVLNELTWIKPLQEVR